MTAPAHPLLVLVGLPGAGKSTVGRLLAERLGVAFLDTDAAVEAAAGTTIAEYFAVHGEAAFRELEHQEVRRALTTHPGVLALGGGAVLDARTRQALAGHRVVHLDVPDSAALERLRDARDRPLLVGDPTGRLAALRTERAGLYEEVATATVDTSAVRPGEIAAHLAGLVPSRIPVGGQYDVLVGHHLEREVVAAVAGATSALLVHAPATADQAGDLARRIESAGVQTHLHELPDAEDAKTLAAAADCWQRMGAVRLGREDVVVAVGGGATTDVGGFVAATWLRGIRLVNVPTTLLGMVDAAVGGKTGINTTAGKNLVGAFHPPAAVVCDLEALRSLPDADLRAGLAEVVKCGFIADETILRLIEDDGGSAARRPGSPVLRELVERAVAVKARVVGEDLREAGLREILNYGHTFAHAVERVEGYRWRHGDAVAVGMVFVAELAHACGLLDAAVVDRHRRLLETLGLPTSYRGADLAALTEAMRHDKKTRGGALRFVALTEVGRTTVLRAPAEEALETAFRAVSSPDGRPA
ncbi:3-dehydroquinate synthase [Georgenia alba]|uniref:Multifunctional fusion protein n=1 Tax=Georgenia alba TaxID=2233858 RepID=A0ABW2QBP6_9MICO